jgi:CHAP domain
VTHDIPRPSRTLIAASTATFLVLIALFCIAPPAVAQTPSQNVHAFGGAGFFGATNDRLLNRPLVGLASTPTGRGYWLVGRDGGVFAFGDAHYYGSTGDLRLTEPVVGMAATPSGHGYWMVASDGGVFAFGDARYLGSMGGRTLDQPIVAMARTASGRGYWLVGRDGGIFAFGDARFYGSTGRLRLAQPIVGIATTNSTDGYWLAARDGGVFAFGAARFAGSTSAASLGEHVVDIASNPSGGGYWTAATGADTGGYPDAHLPCEQAPYAISGYCTTPDGPYDWGPVPAVTPGWTVATTNSPRGYSYRNCTDWVAWRLEQLGVPSSLVQGLGNGGQWAANAVGRAGLVVSSTPRRGDAAVQSGNPGHVAFVEAVYADGAIQVSEYNRSFDGTYDDTRIGTPAQLGFSAFILFS